MAALQTEYSLWSRDLEVETLALLRELEIGLVPNSPLFPIPAHILSRRRRAPAAPLTVHLGELGPDRAAKLLGFCREATRSVGGTRGEGRTTRFWPFVPALVVAGIGWGMVIAALFNVILAAVEDAEIGSAFGVLSAVQSIAGSIGVAVFGSVFFAAVKTGQPDRGFQHALLVQTGLLVMFLALTFLSVVEVDQHDHSEGQSSWSRV